jgi:hypothetical protein
MQKESFPYPLTTNFKEIFGELWCMFSDLDLLIMNFNPP